MDIKSVSSKVVDDIVKDLIAWMYSATDSLADGDFDETDIDAMENIIRSIPTNVEIPDTFWVY